MASRQTKLTPIARSPSQSISRAASQKSLGSGNDGTEASKDLIGGFKPLNVLIFKNGDEYDPGLEMSVTRKQFQHWLNLLDYLTERLKLTEGAVHKIYSYPSGSEVRHFTEMENSGRFFVAAHAKYKKLKYGKHPRLPNFKTSQQVRSPRMDPPSLHSKDSLQYYLKTHGFKQKLGDIWQDPDFNLKKKRPSTKSEQNVSETIENEEEINGNNDYEQPGITSEELYSAPERSKSDFGVRSLRNDEENFEAQNEAEQRFQPYEEENNQMRNFSAKKTFSNERQFPSKSMSEFGVRTEFGVRSGFGARSDIQYDQRRSSVSPVYGSRPKSIPERRQSVAERDKTATVTRKRNIKLQTEHNEEEEKPKTSSFTNRNLATSDMSVSTDEARFELLKKEKTYINDYWKDKDDRSKRLKQKPPSNIKTRSSSMVFGQKNIREQSLDRVNQRLKPSFDNGNANLLNRESRLPKNVPVKNRSNNNSRTKQTINEPEKSPRWAEDLVLAVRSLTDRVDQLSSARSKKESDYGLFADDED